MAINRSLAIIIGIDKYSDIPTLTNAVADAEELAKVLKDKYDYEVLLLTNDGATKEKLSELLENLKNKTIQIDSKSIQVEKTDRLLFYFAGHGFAEETQDSEDGKPAGYFMPQDAKSDDRNTWLSMQTVYEVFTELGCHHLLMILDCCFAGRISWVRKERNAAHPRKLYRQSYDRFIKYPTQQIITSAAHNEKAQDSFRFGQRGTQNGHSPFAHYLLKVLQRDSDGGKDKFIEAITDDEVITVHELFTYLQNQLGKVAEGQTPALSKPRKSDPNTGEDVFLKGEYIFPITGFDEKKLENFELNKDTNPYKGLASFETKDSNLFFGRRRLIEAPEEGLISKVSKHPITVVLGVSGSGKSSLVKAGLIPALTSKERSREWYILNPIRPGEAPISALARAIMPIKNANLVAQMTQVDFLDNVLKSKKIKIIEKAWKGASPESKILLIFDNFEQLKDLCDRSDQKTLLTTIKNNISNIFNSLIEELNKDFQSLSLIVKQWSLNHPNIKLLLIIDQSEELITLCKDEQERESFLRLLAEALVLQESLTNLRIVLTLRSDFEPQLREVNEKKYKEADWQKVWQNGRFFVTPMNREELQKAIEEPAAARALFFESPKLVNQLIDEVIQMPGGLPLLSFTLSELYLMYLESEKNDGRNDRTITEADYNKLGGVTRSLIKRADDEYKALVQKPEDKDTIRDMILRMVTMSGGELARRQVPLSELEYSEPEKNNLVQKAIRQFVEARLLVSGRNTKEGKDYVEEEKDYVEPAHEYLVRGWPKLKEWVDKEPERLALQQSLNNDASLWDKARLNKKEQEAVGYLWNDDPRLEEVKGENWLNKLETEFVERSVKQKEDILERTQQQRDEARQGEIRALSALSESRFQNDQLGALTTILKAGRQLQELKDSRWLNKELLESTKVVLLQTLSKVQEYNRLEGMHRGGVSQVDFSHDGKMIATVDRDGQVILWKQDGSLFNILSGYSVAFSPNSQMIATGQGNTVTLRNTDDTGFKILPECRGQVSAIAFSTDGNMIATASKEEGNTPHEIVQLWNIEDCTLLTTLKGGMHVQMAVAFSPDGKMIASVGWHGAKLWNLHDATGKTLEGHSLPVVAVSFSSDNEMIATASVDATVKLWNKDGTCLKTLQGHRDGVWGVSFSPDGEMIATGGQDTTVKLWNKDGTLLRTLYGHKAVVRSVRFSPDGQLLASASDDGTVKFWQLSGTSLKILGEHTDVVYAVGFSPNSEMIATTSGHGFVNLWKPDGTLVKSEKWHGGPASTLDFSPNGQMMVTAAGDRSVKLSRLDGTDGQLLEGHTGELAQREVFAVSFSHDSQIFVLGDVKGRIELWKSDGTCLKTFSGHQGAVMGISFSPDDQMFATASNDGKVKLWNRDGSLVKTLWHSSPLLKVAFSPDLDPLNQIIAAASSDGTVQIWNRNDIKLKPLKGHSDVVSAVRFSPDGQLIATASYDKTVKLWKRDGTLHKTLDGHNDRVNAVAFSPDGKTIASASSDKTVILWRFDLALDLDELVTYGCDWVRDYLNNNPNGKNDRKVLSLENLPALKHKSPK